MTHLFRYDYTASKLMIFDNDGDMSEIECSIDDAEQFILNEHNKVVEFPRLQE